MGNMCGGSSKPNVTENSPTDAPSSSTKARPKSQKETPHVFEARYHIENELGRGAFSVVHRAVSKIDGQVRAVKVCERGSMSSDDEEALFREVDVMKKLNHPNIVQLVDFFVGEDKYYLVLELLEGGELFDRIVQKKVYNEKEARDCVKAILNGLKCMHDQNIAHRDLKPENLLLASPDDDVSVKIADFGFAAFRKQGVGMETQCGTPNYVAPEILKGGGDYSKAVDMWSMGVITYIILGGYPPFHHSNQAKLFAKIKKGAYQFHPKYWDNVSVEAKEFISQLLCLDVTARLTVDRALEHPWMKSDGIELSTRDLGTTVAELRKNQSLAKFRSAVHSVVAVERMHRLINTLSQVAEATSLDETDPTDTGGFGGQDAEEPAGEGEDKREATATDPSQL